MKRFAEVISFIRKTYNKPDGFIALHEPVFIGNEKKYISMCIDSTFVSSVGKYVDQFEEDIARFTGAKKAVACVNGTNALHIALMLAGVGQHDEVITQPLSFIATANAISYCGAAIVFVDVDKDTMGLSPMSLSSFLKKNAILQSDGCYNKKTNKRIAAVVPMHTFGHPCRIDEISAICKQYNIPLIEDAAESLGSYCNGQHTGTFGQSGIISFNGNKIITTGGGGMLLFNDEQMAIKAKHLTTQAKVPHPWEFVHDEIGYNYRMPNINAAMGVAQLEQISKFLKSKRELSLQYKAFFQQIGISFITEPENTKSNYWLNCILFENKTERDSFLEYSNKNKVMARPVWCLLNELKMYKNCQTDYLENSIFISDRLVNLPSSVIIKTT